MEVHAHSHSERKKWTHYLWEFLMLFLAVFCGFLAEYQLEHKIEKDREKQFIKSLINDVAADTARLNEIVRSRNERERMFDSLSFLLDQGPPYDSTNMIYYYGIFIPRNITVRFIPNDGTMQQLKNAGGLRMIPDKESADRIVMYDAAIKRLLLTEELELNPNQQSLKKQTISIFNLSSVPDIETKFSFGRFDDNLPLLRYDKYMLNEFYNEIWIMKRKVGLHIKNLVKAKSTAEQLLEFLKEKY
jgi:hypothetical protein